MDIWKVVGSIALGLVIGLLARFFFEHFKPDQFTAKGLASVIACLVGGTAIGYVTSWLKDPIALALYPVGLLGGILGYRLVWPREEPVAPPAPSTPAIPPVKAAPTDGPTFTVLEVQKVLRFIEKEGKHAHFQRLMRMQANTRATELWVCTLSSDGQIENIVLDGSYGATPHIERNAGQIDVYARFQTAIGPGSEVEIRLEYDLIDSFPGKTEYVGHEVQHETQKVEITVEFHAGRPCLSAWCAKKYAGDLTKLESHPERSDSGLRLSTVITTMKIGEEYRLTWIW